MYTTSKKDVSKSCKIEVDLEERKPGKLTIVVDLATIKLSIEKAVEIVFKEMK
jgi:hypothetical protein